MTEAQIGAGESGVARLHRLDAHLIGAVNHMAGENLLRDGHRPRLGGDGRQENFALHAGDVEREQAAVLDHLAGDFVFACGELNQRNLFSAADLVDHAKVSRGQHAEVLAILLVDALDVLGDHQLDAGRHLGVRRLFAAGTLAAALATDRADKATALHVAALDGRLVAALQAGVGKLAQGLVEEKADMRRGDLVGRDVVAQFGIAFGMRRVPGQIFAGELPLDELRIFGEEEDSPLQADHVGTHFNGSVQQRVVH